jgi:hypothetical protein
MSKRTRKAAPGVAGARTRSAPVKVSKPFPWGTVLVSVVLGALLVGIVAYAFLNQGTGVRDLLQEDDRSFSDLIVEEDPARDHVDGPVEYANYPARPPAGGEHNALPQQCDVYDEQIPAEHAVHSLEHGAVWATYSPDLDEDQVEVLRGLVAGDTHRLMSPLPGQESPIVLTAWGRQLEVDDANDREVRRFFDVYTNGRQTPERGAACVGNTTTGSAPIGANPGQPGVMPTPVPADEAAEPAPEPTG